VKFHWFAQQYYTKLPSDFGDTVRSSWVTPPASVADPRQVGEDYHMYIRLMQQADGLGWDSLLLNEHHQTSLAMTPSPPPPRTPRSRCAATRWRCTTRRSGWPRRWP
jgi:hypothetical protein